MHRNSANSTCPAAHSPDIHNESHSLSTANKRHGAATFSLTSNGTNVCSKGDEGYSIAAVLNNSVKEIGVAFLEFPSFAVSITQFGDTCSYSKLNTLLFTRNPVEVLLSSTTVHDPFTRLLTERFGAEITFVSIPRKYFDVEDGVARLNYLKSTQEVTPSIEDTDHYLSVAAANALVLYAESLTRQQLRPGSLRVRCVSLNHFADLPRSTARALHILPPTAGEAAVGDGFPPDPTAVGAPATACAARPAGRRLGTLMEALPRPYTAMGRRFLRASLLQPLKDRASIQHRLDAVEWLVADPKRLAILSHPLQHLADIDLEKITAVIALNPTQPTDESRRRLLVSLLLFWDALDALQSLHRCLQSFFPAPTEGWEGDSAVDSSPQPFLFRQLAQTLEACLLDEMLALFNSSLDPAVRGLRERLPQGSTAVGATATAFGRAAPPGSAEPRGGAQAHAHASPPRGLASSSITQLMRIGFAIRAPQGSALDRARSVFCQQIQHIADYHARLASQYQLHTLKLEADPDHLFCLSYASSEEPKTRGGPWIHKYAGRSHYQLYLQALGARKDAGGPPGRPEPPAPHLNPLPSRQTAPGQRKPPRVRCTTRELTAHCRAAQRACGGLLRHAVAAAAAGAVLATLHSTLGRLQALTEAVALLDMLLSFAGYAQGNRGVRPLLRDPDSGTPTNPLNRGAFRIVNAYYPSAVSAVSSLVPNSVVWAPGVSVVILTGPNGAGKSLLLRMVGQIFVLAQCGCFVPAESADLFITDRILAHMLCDELPSVLCSSQRRELMELAEISNAATPRSVVLMDELGRSMLYTEGFTLAWAAVMWLRSEGIHSLFSTHFVGITEIPSAFPDTTNMHFALELTEKEAAGAARRTTLSISHHLKPGTCPDTAYGLQAAASLGFPAEVLTVARCLYRVHLEETKGLALLNPSTKR